MTEKTVIKKIPGGKLLRLDVFFSDKIDDVKITGDFFLHPEDTLLDFEQFFKNLEIPLNKEAIIFSLNNILIKKEADLIGVTTEDIVNSLEEALNEN